MGQIQPEAQAIELYPWIYFQQGIKTALEAVSTSQTAINPAYQFRVETNLYRPSIQDIQNQALVNILIDGYNPKNSTNSNVNHDVTFFIDCYVLGQNENDVENPGSLLPADQVAVERLQYLCAQVEYGLRNLQNYYMDAIDSDLINTVQRGKLGLKFFQVEDAMESNTPYAPARFTLNVTFPYSPADHDEVDLTKIFVTAGEWASQFDYT